MSKPIWEDNDDYVSTRAEDYERDTSPKYMKAGTAIFSIGLGAASLLLGILLYRIMKVNDISDSLIHNHFYIFIALGVVLILVGIVLLIVRYRTNSENGLNAIVETGRFTYAKVENVFYDTSISNENGDHPYIIRCRYTDFNGQHPHDFIIKDCYRNPAAYIAANNHSIKIYYLDKNFRRYKTDPKLYEGM